MLKQLIKSATVAGVVFSLVACENSSKTSELNQPTEDAGYQKALSAAVSQLSAEEAARVKYRKPQETLSFFGIEPGMTVVEVLPGGGWYSKILAPYLGQDGVLVGADYENAMWPNFSFASPEFIAQRKDRFAKWQSDTNALGGAKVSAYTLDAFPDSMNNTVDAVLYIRAMHNLSRFEPNGEFLTRALQNTYRVLKSGGRVGIVQHAVGESADDASADGARGYMKESKIKELMEKAGFEFVAKSAINANPKDLPSDSDIVWRLPPSLSTSKDDASLREQYMAIGESNRATLLFKKP